MSVIKGPWNGSSTEPMKYQVVREQIEFLSKEIEKAKKIDDLANNEAMLGLLMSIIESKARWLKEFLNDETEI